MKKTSNLCYILFFLLSCNQVDHGGVEMITDTTQQKVLFRDVANLTQEGFSKNHFNDSIAFLLLPIQAICPSCRKKIIDSIVSNQNRIDGRHFIIISANGGRKTMEAFFRERGHNWPSIGNGLFLDSTNQAYKNGLYIDKPVFFYGSKEKIFKKVLSVPATVKDDLKLFFSKH